MNDIDLYKKFLCHDCKHEFLLPGSTPGSKIECPKCKSKNYENIRLKIN